MKEKNMPELIHPMNDIMMNGMPNLPQILQSAMPKFIPPARYEQNPISLGFSNFKMGQLEKRAEREYKIAKYTADSTIEKLKAMKAVVLLSSDIADSVDEFNHKREVRKLVQRNMELTNNKLELENNNLTIEGYKLQAEATVIGWEAKLSELDYNTKLKQYQEIMGGG